MGEPSGSPGSSSPDDTQRDDRTGWAWLAFLAAGLAVSAAYLLLPRGSDAQAVPHPLMTLAALAAIVIGLRHASRSRRTAWIALAAGTALYLVANLMWYPSQIGIWRPLPYPSVADAVYVAAYVALLVGLVWLLPPSRDLHDLGASIDGLLIAAGLGVLSWTFLIDPDLDVVGVPLAVRLTGAVYPVLDLLMLAAIIRVLLAGSRASPALWLIGLSVAAQVAADVVYAYDNVHGTYTFGEPYVAMWSASFVLLGAAALHPSGLGAAGSAPGSVRASGARRAPLVLAAGLVPLVAIVAESARPEPQDLVALATIGMVGFILAAVRLRLIATESEQLRRSGRELERERLRLQTYLEQMPGIVYTQAVVGDDLIWVGDELERSLGYPAHEWLARPDLWTELVHPDDVPRIREAERWARETGAPFVCEYRLTARDGREIWVRDQSRLLHSPEGEPLFWLGILVDVTDRRLFETALERAEAMYRSLVESLPATTFRDELDPTAPGGGRNVFVSPQVGHLTGHGAAEFLSRPHLWSSLIHPEDRDRVVAADARHRRTGEPLRHEYRILDRDGHVHRVAEQVHVVDVEGVRFSQGTITDVTEQRAAQDALRRRDRILEAVALAAERLLEAPWEDQVDPVLEHLGAAAEVDRAYVFAVRRSPEGTLLASQRFEWTAPGVVPTIDDPGMRDIPLITVGYARWVEVLQAGGVVSGTVDTFPDRERERLEARGIRSILVVPIFTEERWWGFVGFDECRRERAWQPSIVDALRAAARILGAGIARTMAERRLEELNLALEDRVRERTIELVEANTVLEAARQEAVEANLAKSAFLSSASHELRTPLGAILGFGQLLAGSELAEPDRESADEIMRAGRRLLSLVDELLDVSRLESGRVALSIEPVDVQAVLEEVMASVQPLASDAEIRFEAEVACPRVTADRPALVTALTHLVRNAIQHGRRGGVVRFSSTATGRDTATLEVSDDGPGIPVELLPRLFTPFDRLDAGTGAVHGPGIGLALTKRLVEAMGGTITAASVPGSGATFAIELLRPPARAETGAPAVEQQGRRTLVCIQADPTTVRVLEEVLLRRPNVRLVAVMSGELGLETVRAQRPDLVLLDLHLPDIPGDQVLSSLVADPATSDVPVIVISATASRAKSERILTAGARAYLTKPIEAARFLELLDRFLPDEEGRQRA